MTMPDHPTAPEPPQENDDMSATSAEAPHVHRYTSDNPQARTPKVTGTSPADELEPSHGFKARLRTMMEDVPYDEAEATEAPVSRDEHRLTVFRDAWTNSLEAARVNVLADWTIDRLAVDQKPTILRQYVDNIGTQAPYLNLVLTGRVGPGKTSAAIAVGNAAVERGLMTRFIRHSTYLTWLRPEGSPADLQEWQIRKRFRDCDLLILDDLGAELDDNKAATRFVRDETLGLIGDRINSGRATIIITNESSTALAATLGERVVSRIGDRGYAVTFTGPDRRRPDGPLTW